MSDSSTPHDRFVKAIFTRREALVAALSGILPAALVAAIDWDRLEYLPTEYIGPDLTLGRADLIVRVPLRGRPAFIFFLYEHQSTVDRWMPYRVLVYAVRAWERWRRDEPDDDALPAIIPVVLYHGDRPWPAERSLTGLLALPPALCAALAPHLPDFELLVDDLGRRGDGELAERTRDALALVALLLLKHGRTAPDLYPHLVRWLDHMVDAAERPGGVEAMRQALYYAYQISELEPGRIEPLLAERLAPRHREEIMTTAQRLREEGRREGREEGREEGRAEARLDGERRLLMRQLELKFRALPPALAARLAAATGPELERWAALVLTAETLDEVFAG